MLSARFVAFATFVMLSATPVLAEPDNSDPIARAKSGQSGTTTFFGTKSAAADVAPADAAASAPAVDTAKPLPPSAAVSSEPPKAVEVAKPAPLPEPTLTASIDLAQQKMVVSENGAARYSWPISSGTAEFPTPRGTFRPEWTSKMWYSRKYDNAPMPNAVFINGGVAVHATYHTGSLGQPASHGCIRLAPGNAKIFYNLVQRHGLKATKVSIYGTPKWRSPAIARRDVRPQRYASQDSGSWFWGSSYGASAYDPGFAQQRKYRPTRRAYAYDDVPPRVYRRNGQRYVYVQRPTRKVYYYNNYGYGYASGW